MPSQEQPSADSRPHDTRRAADPFPVLFRAPRSRRPGPPFHTKGKIEPQHHEPNGRQRLRHSDQQFRLAIRPRAVRQHNSIASGPLRFLQKTLNHRLGTFVNKPCRHVRKVIRIDHVSGSTGSATVVYRSRTVAAQTTNHSHILPAPSPHSTGLSRSHNTGVSQGGQRPPSSAVSR